MVGNLYRQLDGEIQSSSGCFTVGLEDAVSLAEEGAGNSHPAEFGVLRTDLGEGVGNREPGPENTWTPDPWGYAPRPGPLTTEL